MATVVTSSQFSLNVKDLLKGLLFTVINSVLTALLPLLQAGTFKFNWALIGGVAATTAISYLLKNYFSPSEIILKNPAQETVQAVKSGEATVKVISTTTAL